MLTSPINNNTINEIRETKIINVNTFIVAVRQSGRLAGFSLFVSNTDVSTNADIKGSTLCYKDGSLLPPLNFTRVCTEWGRYVIYYNERLDGVIYPTKYEVNNVYTELCEVIVEGKY